MRVHHLAFRTTSLARLTDFYEHVLGLGVERRDASRTWLRAGDAILMLESAGPDEPRPPPGSLELVAFAVAADERAAWEARLERAGVTIEARTSNTLYFRDPEGRRLGVSSYPIPERRS